MSTVKAGYVKADNGKFYVQKPADNQWGFDLFSDDQVWAGGIGLAAEWELVNEAEVPESVKEELGWILEE